MKKLILAAVCLVLLYTGFWYYNAGVAKHELSEKWDEAALFLEKQGFSLQNEGLSVKGFPFGYEVEIKSPKIKKTAKNQDLNNPVKSIALDGTLNFISNLTGTNFTVQKRGDDHLSIQNADKSNPKIDEYLISGTTSFTFDVEEKSYLHAIINPFKAIFEAIENNDKEFLVGKKGSLFFDHLHMINEENPAVTIFEIEKGMIGYKFKKTDDQISFVQITSEIKGLNADTLIIGSEAYTPGRERSLKEIAILLSLPKPGNIALSLELDLTAPFYQFEKMTLNSSIEDIPPFNFDLKKFEVSSAFGTASHQANLSFQNLTETLKRWHFNALGTSKITKAEFDSLRNQWDQFLNNLPVCEGGKAEKVDAACPLIKSLIPKLDEFGKITSEINFDFDMTNFKNPIQNAKLLMKQLNYFSEIYGVKSGGSFDFADVLTANYKIELMNYETLFKDLFSYLQKVQRLLPFISGETNELPKITENHLVLILKFLKEISDDPKNNLKDITITLKVNGPNQVEIGTLTEGAFTKKAEALFAAFANDFKGQAKEKETEKVKEGAK